MLPIFAAIGAALSAVIVPVAKAVALAAVGGAAAFGTNKALTVLTQKDPPKPAPGNVPKDKPVIGAPCAHPPVCLAQAYPPEPFMTRALSAPLSPMARL